MGQGLFCPMLWPKPPQHFHCLEALGFAALAPCCWESSGDLPKVSLTSMPPKIRGCLSWEAKVIRGTEQRRDLGLRGWGWLLGAALEEGEGSCLRMAEQKCVCATCCLRALWRRGKCKSESKNADGKSKSILKLKVAMCLCSWEQGRSHREFP